MVQSLVWIPRWDLGMAMLGELSDMITFSIALTLMWAELSYTYTVVITSVMIIMKTVSFIATFMDTLYTALDIVQVSTHVLVLFFILIPCLYEHNYNRLVRLRILADTTSCNFHIQAKLLYTYLKLQHASQSFKGPNQNHAFNKYSVDDHLANILILLCRLSFPLSKRNMAQIPRYCRLLWISKKTILHIWNESITIDGY